MFLWDGSWDFTMICHGICSWDLASGKHTKNEGKSPQFTGLLSDLASQFPTGAGFYTVWMVFGRYMYTHWHPACTLF